MADVGCAGILVADTFCGPMKRLPQAGELLALDADALEGRRLRGQRGDRPRQARIRRRRLRLRRRRRLGRSAPAKPECRGRGLRAGPAARLASDQQDSDSPGRGRRPPIHPRLRGQCRIRRRPNPPRVDRQPEGVLSWRTVRHARRATPTNWPNCWPIAAAAESSPSWTSSCPRTIPAWTSCALLPHIDYFLPNDDEAQRLTGFADAERQIETFLRPRRSDGRHHPRHRRGGCRRGPTTLASRRLPASRASIPRDRATPSPPASSPASCVNGTWTRRSAMPPRSAHRRPRPSARPTAYLPREQARLHRTTSAQWSTTRNGRMTCVSR